MIKKRLLGRTGLSITECSLGTFHLTTDFLTPHNEALCICRRAAALGINFIDTAAMYGAGESQAIISEALGSFSSELVIADKVGWFSRGVCSWQETKSYKSKELIRRQFEHSLYLLKREYVDILYIHESDWDDWWDDFKTARGPVMQFLLEVKREGKIRFMGVSGCDTDKLTLLVKTGLFDTVLTFDNYDLVSKKAREKLIPTAKKQNVGVILGAPFRQGLLAKKDEAAIQERVKEGRLTLEEAEKVKKVYRLSDENGIPLPEMAIRFLLADKDIAAIIPGPRTVEELENNVASAMKGELPSDVLRKLEEIEKTPLGS